ncbi:MAG: SRPBCC family protein [Gammaproteobacteria bacterium]
MQANAVGCIAAGLLAIGLSLGAAEVSEADVRREDDLYRLHVVARIDASLSAVWKVLTDYHDLGRLHYSVKESTYLGRTPEGADRVRIRMHPCVLFFCVDVTQIVEFHAVAERRLVADFDRRASHFEFGRLQWRLAHTPSAGTDLVFDAELVPAFWIPPLLGPWILKSALRKTATEIIMNLNRLSRSRSQ